MVGTLENYRTVAEAWPEKSRERDIAFTVHKELAAREDRFTLIRTIRTSMAARELVSGGNPAGGNKDKPPSKAQQIKDRDKTIRELEKALAAGPGGDSAQREAALRKQLATKDNALAALRRKVAALEAAEAGESAPGDDTKPLADYARRYLEAHRSGKFAQGWAAYQGA